MAKLFRICIQHHLVWRMATQPKQFLLIKCQRPDLSDKSRYNLPEATVLSREDVFQSATRTASLFQLEYSARFLNLCK